MDPENQRLRLSDGRRLAYAEYGDPQGQPLFYCHGFPASRLEAALVDQSAQATGMHIVAPDRPGMGRSTFQPRRRMLDWPQDLAVLADYLGWQRFMVLGVSGGGPYALACAFALPHRVTAVGTVCGLGPVYRDDALLAMQWPARIGFRLAQTAPRVLSWCYGGVTAQVMHRFPQLVKKLLLVAGPAADHAVLAEPRIGGALQRWIKEALRQGGCGALQEFAIYAHPWGFNLTEIPQHVYLWHGDADRTVPPLHSEMLAAMLPRSELTMLPNEGHFSLPVRHAKSIFQTLLKSA